MCYCTHFPGHPAGEDLASLFLAEARTREISFADKGDDVHDDLMFVEDGIDDYRDNGGEISFSHYFDQDYDKASGLENGTATCVSIG